MSSAIPFELVEPSKRARAKANSVHLGAAGEAWCAQQHALMERRGVAIMTKLYPPTVGGFGHMRYAKRSTVDYAGVLLPTGLHVAVECKSFAGDRLQLSEVKAHQRAHLDALDDARVAIERRGDRGPLPLLLMIELATDARGNALPLMRAAYVVPWWRARAALDAKGHGSLLVRDVAQHRVKGSDLYLEPWGSR